MSAVTAAAAAAVRAAVVSTRPSSYGWRAILGATRETRRAGLTGPPRVTATAAGYDHVFLEVVVLVVVLVVLFLVR